MIRTVICKRAFKLSFIFSFFKGFINKNLNSKRHKKCPKDKSVGHYKEVILT